jgi:hypothetical protein
VAGELEQPREGVAVGGGPVGLAETNSIRMRSGEAAVPPPQPSPAASTCAAAAVYQASARKTLTNPGPATSTFSTRSPSLSLRTDRSRSAISRGGAPSLGASSIAAFVE